jgi:hypothetical protein
VSCCGHIRCLGRNARSRSWVNGSVRLADDDYREAEVRAYQSMGIGCLLLAVAVLIAAGAAVWIVIWYFNTQISLFQAG